MTLKRCVSFFFCLLLLHQAQAQVRLPRIIRDSMIIQRNKPVHFWGWASKGETVFVTINKKTAKTTTGNDGKWKVQLPSMQAGGPYTIQVKGKNAITLKDVLVGDVWFCAGQSNMVHQMALHSIRYADEIATANDTDIRQFWVPNTTNLQTPQEDLPNGSWKWANPTDVKDFSAVAYFFAKQLHDKYHVPIGIINASWGGIPIEAMMSEESLKAFPVILSMVEKNKDTAYVNSTNRKAFADMQAIPVQEDKGTTEKWFDPSYQPIEWHRIAVPGYWEDQGVHDLNGVVWYRKEVDVPARMTQVPAKVFLGRIVDADVLYINGKQVGSTTYLYPQRRYSIPDGVLKSGKNLFVVRITNNAGKGGFVPDKPYQLIAGNDTIGLTGYWDYKVGLVNKSNQNASTSIALQNQPTALYNAMVTPEVDYSIKGFVWYQGESNAGKPDEYAKLQPAMITDWRKQWKESNLPFLFVQLPGFGDYNYLPSESGWAAFREAQARSLSLPNTAMAVAIDVGEWNDIHPDRKKEVGDRLALAAEKIAYGDSVVYSGPVYQSSSVDDNQIRISFTNTGSGLATSDNEAPAEFAIAGEDKQFVWANAKIEGDKVVLWNDNIKAPKHVRYAWADTPVNPNLINKEGLPAAPFEAIIK